MILISCYRFSVHFQFYFPVFTEFFILKMSFSIFLSINLCSNCHKVSCNVPLALRLLRIKEAETFDFALTSKIQN